MVLLKGTCNVQNKTNLHTSKMLIYALQLLTKISCFSALQCMTYETFNDLLHECKNSF